MKGTKMGRGPLVHLGVLCAATIVAVGVWTRDKESKASSPGDVTVWSGRAADVERVAYEGKSKKVELEAKRDAQGRYFVGTIEREIAHPPAGDAGAAPPPEHKRSTIVSVSAGDKLAGELGPLKALRALGRVGDERAEEFGLASPEGTMKVKIGGVERALVIGSPTPGGGDRYVKDAASGEVYVLRGEPIRTLESADSLMLERELHEWKDGDLSGAKILADGKSREIVRGGGESKRFWADASSPETNDETLGNWMSKLDRLRPTEFVADPPREPKTVVRVEYRGGSKPLGYVEVVKAPGAEGSKPEYLLQTERTRLYAKVPATLAEQLEQDLGSAVK